ncbi:nuclear transport factor 2 family protein [Alkaliphilus sp. MSJ-5]|uniref:Nuclear transport factor 2 family protein n=1 Tax=Alkaliphilus flagellatus TaxID=2841507 RepID=A0ABS6G1G6_9FIRM|nr:nuclear transport factor 2 family protein [Alkaliphilus flagellatus]MBU5676327.1 nuclear transport factor 2 family protein [Alkaliphilus flagellatus]
MGENVVKLFWEYIHNADFDSLNELISDDASIWLPNTKEVFKGKRKYIEFNKKYPDRWYVDLEKLYVCGETVISVAKIFNSENTASFYVTSFFKVNNNLIEEIVEYWGDNGEPPKWRLHEKLSERY